MNDTLNDLRRAREQLHPAVGAFDRWSRARRRRERISRAGVISVALVIGLVGVPLMFGLIDGSPDGGTQPFDAASVDLGLRAGEYYYQHVGGRYELWWALDGSGRIRNADGDETTYGPGEFQSDTIEASGLSTDPTHLELQLRQRVEPTGASPEPYQSWYEGCGCTVEPGQEGPITWGLVRSIHDLLLAPDVTPEQKAAVFHVAEGLDGMTVTRDATDPAGRPAILLSINTEQRLHEWWFDPASLQLLAIREGDGYGGATIESAGITSSTESSDLSRVFVSSSPVPSPTPSVT
jgi:hypothetical protein